jgi:YVTN family beta-propeller protein
MNRSFTRCLSLFILAILTVSVQADDSVRRLLYVSSRDGAGGRGGKGIYVYDIDHGHKLVKFIDMPELGGTRGATACAATGRFYIAHNQDKLLCLDLKTEKVLWEKQYPKEEGGCDRIGITPDGKKLYAPGGWWSNNPNVKVIDGENGDLITNVAISKSGGIHNLIVSLDGTRVYCGSVRDEMLSVIDTKTDTVVKKVGPIIGVIQPLTIDGSHKRAYINTHLYRKPGYGVGFEIGDVQTGKILHIVNVPGLENEKGRCHGIGLTPDEKEVWLCDQSRKQMHVFDNTSAPPKFVKTLPVAIKSHGWICFSRDGQYAWPDTGEVFDARTKEVVAHLTEQPNGKGSHIASSKFIEIHWKGEEVIWAGRQMGVGYVSPK